MLQKDLPNARIMTFNYDSVWFGDKPTRLTIDGVATNLLDQLQMERSVSLLFTSSTGSLVDCAQ